MRMGGDAADQMVHEGIQVTESAIKLAGLGAKNLVALLLALLREGTEKNPFPCSTRTKIDRAREWLSESD